MAIEAALVDQLERILQHLDARVKGVRGSVVADSNGLPLASRVAGTFDVGVIAAMGALITQSSDAAFGNLGLARPNVIVIEGETANLAALSLQDISVSLLTVLEKHVNIGLAKIELRRAAQEIGNTLGVAPLARPRIEELFILYSSGVLIRHYSDTLRTDFDRDVLGGMLSAVQAFVRETMAAKEGTLDEMRYGNHSICFVRGTYTIAAVVVTGTDSEAARYVVFDALKDFEERYHESLEHWDGILSAFPGIDECFEKVLRP